MTQTMRNPIAQFGVFHRFDPRFRQGVISLRAHQSVVAAHRFQRDPVCDADDPGGDAGSAAKFLRTLPDDQEGVVDDLFDGLVLRGDSRQKPRQAPVVTQIQRIERAAVAARHFAQQIFI